MSHLETLMQDEEFRRLYVEEGCINETLETINRWMAENGISKAELARRLGTSRANVTHVTGGEPRLLIKPITTATRPYSSFRPS